MVLIRIIAEKCRTFANHWQNFRKILAIIDENFLQKMGILGHSENVSPILLLFLLHLAFLRF